MPHPLVVHCKKSHYDEYIGRPGKWGNMFTIGRDGTREEVVAKYEQRLLSSPQVMAEARQELRGKVLG